MNNPRFNALIERHEAVMHELIRKAHIPAPILKEAMTYTLFSGGKRLRPILVYLCGDVVDAREEVIDIIAAAIEMVHCYSLIQDDLPAMDNDDFRRGRPACHRTFDEATALLVSDGLHGLACEILLTQLPQFLENTQVIQITLTLLKAIGFSGMISGQSLDLSELGKSNVNTHQLEEIHRLKTGKLFSSCADLVLLSQSVCDKVSSSLSRFLENFGIAFQMQDDFHDRYSSSDISGKNRASDTANNKTTFASLLDKQALLDLINRYYQEAYLALETLGEKGYTLIEFTRFLHQRTQ
jgi:farnesyl diphosphate synthase